MTEGEKEAKAYTDFYNAPQGGGSRPTTRFEIALCCRGDMVVLLFFEIYYDTIIIRAVIV